MPDTSFLTSSVNVIIAIESLMFVKLWLVILLTDILPIYAYGVFFYLYLHTLTGNNVFIKKSFSSSFQILVSEAPCEVQMSLAAIASTVCGLYR